MAVGVSVVLSRLATGGSNRPLRADYCIYVHTYRCTYIRVWVYRVQVLYKEARDITSSPSSLVIWKRRVEGRWGRGLQSFFLPRHSSFGPWRAWAEDQEAALCCVRAGLISGRAEVYSEDKDREEEEKVPFGAEVEREIYLCV